MTIDELAELIEFNTDLHPRPALKIAEAIAWMLHGWSWSVGILTPSRVQFGLPSRGRAAVLIRLHKPAGETLPTVTVRTARRPY